MKEKNGALLNTKIKNPVLRELKRNGAYYFMMLPAVAIVFLFSYLPLPGIIVAFQDYNFVDKFKSPFVGLSNFKFFFGSEYALRTTFNTVFINLNYLVLGTLMSVTLAIVLNEVRGRFTKKICQNAMFLPYFFSSVILGKLVTDIVFSDQFGVANQIIKAFGGDPVVWSQTAGPWPWIIIIAHLWQTTGYSSIIYLASITGMDDQLFEAASLDGASRWQQIKFLIIPMLLPTIITMSLLSIGGMIRGDFATIYAIIGDNGLLFKYTDVIDTYIFRAIKKAADFGPTAAVSLYQSVVGFILVFGSNALVKLYDKDAGLF